MHFVVAKDIQDNNFVINDPWQLTDTNNHTLNNLYPDMEYRSQIKFIPTQSNLSYLSSYWYPPTVSLLVNYEGEEIANNYTGNFRDNQNNLSIEEQGMLAFSDDPQQGLNDPNGSLETAFQLAKPPKGRYQLIFNSPISTDFEYDTRAFNVNGHDSIYTFPTRIGENSPVIIEIEHNPGDLSSFVTFQEISFTALKRKVLELENRGEIYRQQTSRQLIHAVELAEKLIQKNPQKPTHHLNTLLEKLAGQTWKNFMSTKAKEELASLTLKLISHL